MNPEEQAEETPKPETFIKHYLPRPIPAVTVTEAYVRSLGAHGWGDYVLPLFDQRDGRPLGVEVKVGAEWGRAHLGDRILFPHNTYPEIFPRGLVAFHSLYEEVEETA